MTGYSMLDTRCWILDAEYSMLDTRCWILDAGNSILDTRCWMLEKGRFSAFGVRLSAQGKNAQS